MQAINDQMPALKSVVDTMNIRVNEGSELPVEVKRARVNLAQAQQRLESFQDDEDYSETLLAVMLGYPATDRVRGGRIRRKINRRPFRRGPIGRVGTKEQQGTPPDAVCRPREGVGDPLI